MLWDLERKDGQEPVVEQLEQAGMGCGFRISGVMGGSEADQVGFRGPGHG